MEQIIQNKGCTGCAMGDICRSVPELETKICLINEPQQEYPLMIIGDRPSKDDLVRGTILDNRILNLMIDQVVKIPDGVVYRTFAMKCGSLEKDIDPKNTGACVSTYLQAEIAKVKPKAILVMGEQAMNAVLGITGITKERGKIIEKDFDGYLVEVIPTFSLGYVERVETHMKTFAEDLQRAYHLSIGFEAQNDKTKITICDTTDKINTLLDFVDSVGRASFDYETTGLDYWNSPEGFYATCLSITFQQGSSYIIPIRHKEPIFEGKKVIGYEDTIFTEEQCLQNIELLRVRFFENPLIHKIAHNLKYDLHICRTLGIHNFRGKFDDTMLMHHVLNGRLRHGLKEVADKYFPDFSGYEDTTKKYKWDAMPARILFPYSGCDTDVTLRLATQLENELLADERSYILYRNLSMPFCFAAEKAEYKGMLIDRDFTLQAIQDVDTIIEEKIAQLKKFKQVQRYENFKREQYINNRLEELQTRLIEAGSKALASKNKAADTKLVTLEAKLPALEQKIAELTEEHSILFITADPKIEKKLTASLTKIESAQRKLQEVKTAIETLKTPLVEAPETLTIKKVKEEIALLKTGGKQIYEGVNFASDQQMSELIYSEAGFNITKLKDKWSRKEIDGTGRAVLEDLKDNSGFLKELLILRSLEKMSGTYIQGIWNRVDPSCYVHTDLKQIGTYTGRLCVSGETLITTDTGLITIKDIVENKLDCFVTTHKGNQKQVIGWYIKGEEQMYEVETEEGHTIKCTLGHKFLTNKGWKSLENILALQTENSELEIIIYAD